MLSIRRILVILLWCSILEANDHSDGSHTVEPSHFFVTNPLFSLENILEGSPELEKDFHELSPQERTELAGCIAALNDVFVSVFLETMSE